MGHVQYPLVFSAQCSLAYVLSCMLGFVTHTSETVLIVLQAHNYNVTSKYGGSILISCLSLVESLHAINVSSQIRISSNAVHQGPMDHGPCVYKCQSTDHQILYDKVFIFYGMLAGTEM